MADGRIIDADIVIVAIGVRPRDELFRAAEGEEQVFTLGQRGGVVINDYCATEVPGIWAIGEVANFDGMCLGLVAPANTMAEIVADRLHGGDATFPGFDTATKLKLSGVDVASFGDALRPDRARPRNRLRRPRPRRLPEDRHHRRCQDPARRHLRRRRLALHQPAPACWAANWPPNPAPT